MILFFLSIFSYSFQKIFFFLSLTNLCYHSLPHSLSPSIKVRIEREKERRRIASFHNSFFIRTFLPEKRVLIFPPFSNLEERCLLFSLHSLIEKGGRREKEKKREKKERERKRERKERKHSYLHKKQDEQGVSWIDHEGQSDVVDSIHYCWNWIDTSKQPD